MTDGNGDFVFYTESKTANTVDITIDSVTRVDGQPDNCGDPPSDTVNPNPNPRPDPGLGPEDEPFVDPEGEPRLPMPTIPDPFGDPVQLPNFPLPDLFGDEDDGGSGNPNVGPPVEKGNDQNGNGDEGGDDDFGDPPEGHIWVGFIVKMSNQGLSEGLQVNSPPEPIYRSTTGNYRAKYDVEGETVYSTPRRIEAETSVYWLDLPGLTLVGSRVNVPSNDSYVVTPLSQPIEEEDEPQQV
jgi:protein TonB